MIRKWKPCYIIIEEKDCPSDFNTTDKTRYVSAFHGIFLPR